MQSIVQIQPPNSEIEWDAYHEIRMNEIFKDYPGIKYDKNHPSFTDEKHYHFLLYINSEVVGCLQLELQENAVGILRMIAIKKEFQGNGYGSTLMQYAHQWLKEKGVKKYCSMLAKMFCNFMKNAVIRICHSMILMRCLASELIWGGI